jgi:hypothetical protein
LDILVPTSYNTDTISKVDKLKDRDTHEEHNI